MLADQIDIGLMGDFIVPRLALHAERLAFGHPISGAEMEFVSDLPEDLATVVASLEERPAAESE